MTSKTMSRIFPVMFQSLLKPHYVYTAWLHKISPTLIVCRICSPMAHLWLLFKKMGYKEENYNFWDFSTTIFDIKCRLWMKLAPALVPLEAWFWYMLFLDLLSAKPCLGFLIELIEQILHTIKVGEILWSQAVYT
jgi:hypothetical protein